MEKVCKILSAFTSTSQKELVFETEFVVVLKILKVVLVNSNIQSSDWNLNQIFDLMVTYISKMMLY